MCDVICRSIEATVAAVVLFCAGLLFIVLGRGYYVDVAADLERLQKIEQYTNAIQQWNASGRLRFERINSFQLQLTRYSVMNVSAEDEKTPMVAAENETTVANVELVAVEEPDALKDREAFLATGSYRPLKYQFDGEVSLVQQPFQPVTGRLTFTAASSGLGHFTLPVVYSRETKVNAGNWKVCDYQNHGAFLPQGCVVYSRLRSICLLVHWDDKAGRWEPVPDVGCNRHPFREPFQYDIVRTGRYEAAQKLNISRLKVTVLSEEDPHYRAHKLTAGFLHFGTTKGQRLSLSSFMFVLAGISFIVVATLACCCWKDIGFYEPPNQTSRGRYPVDMDLDRYQLSELSSGSNPHHPLHRRTTSQERRSRTRDLDRERLLTAQGNLELEMDAVYPSAR
eukprot:NODE_366_length_1432_cov_214.519161_g270_i0.p1 GENE.NODE_366_length_1432_cov_214.519161_g270_i0~~NODE_366_length_1432_cov_214.519161_g270_i0.p1  ORF type:complete len:395 (+),score=86.71 NODE_366_length_1432_cov_214.519161_g270_i0:51-1235(+)